MIEQIDPEAKSRKEKKREKKSGRSKTFVIQKQEKWEIKLIKAQSNMLDINRRDLSSSVGRYNRAECHLYTFPAFKKY